VQEFLGTFQAPHGAKGPLSGPCGPLGPGVWNCGHWWCLGCPRRPRGDLQYFQYSIRAHSRTFPEVSWKLPAPPPGAKGLLSGPRGSLGPAVWNCGHWWCLGCPSRPRVYLQYFQYSIRAHSRTFPEVSWKFPGPQMVPKAF
jgi:hypothetical protein